jgi:hypothetical protein
MDSMLTIVELQDGNHKYRQQINKLQNENIRLRKEKGEAKLPRISLSKMKIGSLKLNGSDISTSSQNSKTRLKISNTSFKIPLKKIKKINKSKINNITNVSAIDPRNAPLLKIQIEDPKLKRLKSTLMDFENQKSKLKEDLMGYRDFYKDKYGYWPTEDDDKKTKNMIESLRTLSRNIEHYESGIKKYELDHSKQYEEAKNLEAHSRSISPGLQIKSFKRSKKL